jgi:lipopolysaccharide export system protein LptC
MTAMGKATERLPRQGGSVGPAATGQRSGAAFARARRHSAFVRGLRILLPAAVILGAGGSFGYTFVLNYQIGPVGFDRVSVDAESVVMERAHVSGMQANGQPYGMMADKAVQDISEPNLVRLEGVDVMVGLENQEQAAVISPRGVFDSDSGLLVLSDGIKVTTQGGVEALLEDANVDLQTGKIVSDRPIEVVADDRTIRADGIEISSGGTRMVFRGGVRMTLAPRPAESAEPAGEVSPAE